ncbi:unnamed protein product [Peronospora farinosa]|uniref:Uncharacterized protein n=1 Tax=Peronospora farinosa TaxID=134698 RepID=A0AAV0TEU6_9STRA|nr:unnamed protein product [Peronospora farinosa]CAI5720807.1 unnamed protein product [Peronospora farinosa]
MAPTLLPTRGSYKDEKNPSILITSQDDFDLHDDWNERGKGPISRLRNSCPDKWSTSPTFRWSSRRLTALSSSVIGATTALTTRAKQLGVGKSTHRAIYQLRKSIGEVTSRTEGPLMEGSTPVHDQSNGIDGMDDNPENEGICYDEDIDDSLRDFIPWIRACT